MLFKWQKTHIDINIILGLKSCLDYSDVLLPQLEIILIQFYAFRNFLLFWEILFC